MVVALEYIMLELYVKISKPPQKVGFFMRFFHIPDFLQYNKIPYIFEKIPTTSGLSDVD